MMKNIIRILKKRRNGGFTLVEMVVSVALLAVLMVGIIISVAPILRTFNDNSKNLVAENVATCIQNYISLGMRDATNVVVIGNTNAESIKNNANNIVNNLKKFCQTKTSEGQYAYSLSCISLKYDSADGRYYLYTDELDITQTGEYIDPFVSSTSVFSKCLYKDMYFNMSIEKALDMDKATETPQPRLKDTARITINTYSDKGYSNLVFSGNGITEFREIGRELSRKGSQAKYSFDIYSGTVPVKADVIDTSTAPADARDVYIFYTSYKF